MCIKGKFKVVFVEVSAGRIKACVGSRKIYLQDM